MRIQFSRRSRDSRLFSGIFQGIFSWKLVGELLSTRHGGLVIQRRMTSAILEMVIFEEYLFIEYT